jgi:hypothetical protein
LKSSQSTVFSPPKFSLVSVVLSRQHAGHIAEGSNVGKGETTHVGLPEQIACDEGHEAGVHERDECGARCPAEVAPTIFVQFYRGTEPVSILEMKADWWVGTVVFLKGRIEAEGCIEDMC